MERSAAVGICQSLIRRCCGAVFFSFLDPPDAPAYVAQYGYSSLNLQGPRLPLGARHHELHVPHIAAIG